MDQSEWFWVLLHLFNQSEWFWVLLLFLDHSKWFWVLLHFFDQSEWLQPLLLPLVQSESLQPLLLFLLAALYCLLIAGVIVTFVLYIFLNKSEDLIFPAPLCQQSLLAATCSAEMLLHPGSSTWCVCTADYWLRPVLFNPPWGLTWVSHVAWGQTRVHCVSCSAFGALKHWTKTTTLLPLQVLAVSLLWKHCSKSRFRPSLPVSLTPDEWTQSEETHRSSSRMIQWCHHVHTAPGGKTGFLQLVSWYIIPGVVHLHGNMKVAEC